jgi:hypothetical protein
MKRSENGHGAGREETAIRLLVVPLSLERFLVQVGDPVALGPSRRGGGPKPPDVPLKS